MDPRLLELLVCPLCKGPLEVLRPPLHETHELVCHHDRLVFPVRNGISILMAQEARELDINESPDSGMVPLT